ncbi:X-Pro dipeptidyl-peptidase C-terminal non-catalytic domain-containing protein [Pleurostoma richardsiae]|uniref:X-Pro dipeptidyl-peptidase C-terminal non-catalytic domain-containing protein n=1 Tax=Pleurostoma richardsiae TaxID=41990 RepID=A0AA38RN46_9PEZI|nr:X-Pro dipeptidyl-peptidase C-terminal non-catalytic domain-containing protein [Pleurostoma richardsiae]
MPVRAEPTVVPITPPEPGVGGYQELNPRSEVLPAGWNGFGGRPLPCDILVEHDVAITVRDGAKVYCDIYRPPGSNTKVPALLCWSPFGKKFNGLSSLKFMTPWNLGIPSSALSGLEKFEAPDPADWIPRGYAVVNIDSRGSGDSDGVMCIMGTQEAEDGYDTIEELAKMSWCSGAVGLVGNSHLAIIQWFIAALRPPSLKAIAPWEGCGDLYREQFAKGGIYAGDLFDKLISKYLLHGRHGMESFKEMYAKHPLANDWWNDKRPDMTKIQVPTYITGTWTNTMHGMGAIRGWLEVDTPHKWLRWHGTQEWYDLWGNEESREELMLFLDHYLKNEDNGWEKTPHVRMSVLRFGLKDPISNIVEDDFPPHRTEYRKYYLASKGQLASVKPTQPGLASYDAETAESASFALTFNKTTRIMGIPKAVLYMSCLEHDDLDIYVLIEKIDAQGNPMLNLNIPWSRVPVKSFEELRPEEQTEVILYKGPTGVLRASLREIDERKSMHQNWPFFPLQTQQKIPRGDVVKLEIGIWAYGVEYEAGEGLRVRISGRDMAVSNFGSSEHVDNRGRHRIHFGGDTPSYVILPFV